MDSALKNFAAGVIGTLALAGGMGIVIWLMISILEFFRPMFGVLGALIGFGIIASFVVGIVCFVVTILETPKPE